jgi:hypothetical protein
MATKDEEQLRAFVAAQKARKDKELADARAEADTRGKEKFDLDRLFEIYVPRIEGTLDPIEKGSDGGRLAYEYYVGWPKLTSIGQFASVLYRRDKGGIEAHIEKEPPNYQPSPGVYRMNLLLSLRGPDLVAVGRALYSKGWQPGEVPREIKVDEKQLAPRVDFLDRWADKSKYDLDVQWADETFFGISKGSDIVRLNRRALIDLELERFVAELATIPFETACLDHHSFWGYKGKLPAGWFHGKGLVGAHFMAGWGLVLRGKGHDHLVSRRWITHGGPWRVLTGPNDTTLFQFYDLAAPDPWIAWDQAKPCAERLTYQPRLPTCGIVERGPVIYEPKDGVYDATAKRLVVRAGSRSVPTTEMHDACEHRYSARLGLVPKKRYETIAYTFSSESAARTHLHDLWLRDLECWYQVDGTSVRLDADYAPKPYPPPAWAAGR